MATPSYVLAEMILRAPGVAPPTVLEAAPFQNLDHTWRLRIDGLAGLGVLDRYANHFGIAAQVDVRMGWIEGLSQTLF